MMGRGHWVAAALAAWMTLTSVSDGAEIIDAQPDAGSDGVSESRSEEDAPPPPTRRRRARKAKPVVEEDSEASEPESSSHDIGVSGAIGLSDGFFASLTISYGLNRYMAIDTNGFYESREKDDEVSISYGPEVDFVLRLPNPTMFTPFVGAGPGYIKWHREKDQVTFDNNASLTANYFIGLNVGFTRNFGLQITNRWMTYVDDPPLQFSDVTKHEARDQSRVGLGFYVSI